MALSEPSAPGATLFQWLYFLQIVLGSFWAISDAFLTNKNCDGLDRFINLVLRAEQNATLM